VEKLTKKLSEIIKNGRSTPGKPQEFVNENWTQVTWMEF
jgi:arylsulfatase A